MLELPPTVPDVARSRIASQVLSATAKQLAAMKDDVVEKLVMLFRSDLEACSVDGRMSSSLYTAILYYRRCISGQTQDIEGFNSRLQYISANAPAMRLDIADARMSIRESRLVDPEHSSTYHVATLRRATIEQHMHRFA